MGWALVDWMCDVKVQMLSSISVQDFLKHLKKSHFNDKVYFFTHTNTKEKKNNNVHVSTFGMWYRDRVEWKYILCPLRLSTFVITIGLYGFGVQLPLFRRKILCSWKSVKARCGDGTISVRSPNQMPLFESELSADTKTVSDGFRCGWMAYVGIGRLMPPISRIVFGSDSSSVSQLIVVMPSDWSVEVCCIVLISIFSQLNYGLS